MTGTWLEAIIIFRVSLTGGSLHDEQSLVSAFEDMTFRTCPADSLANRCNTAPTNGPYLSGNEVVALNQPRVPTIHQDEYIPIPFSASYANQRTDELAFEGRQQ
jgi:hypothetical protein